MKTEDHNQENNNVEEYHVEDDYDKNETKDYSTTSLLGIILGAFCLVLLFCLIIFSIMINGLITYPVIDDILKCLKGIWDFFGFKYLFLK